MPGFNTQTKPPEAQQPQKSLPKALQLNPTLGLNCQQDTN